MPTTDVGSATRAPADKEGGSMPEQAILVINCGSSSVKFSLFSDEDALLRLQSGAIDGVGLADSRFDVVDGDGASVVSEIRHVPNHAIAVRMLLKALEQHPSGASTVAVGHRIAHGGSECDCPLPVDERLAARLHSLIPLAPLHLPHNLAGIDAIRTIRPDLPQIACFDTAFHHGLPRLARLTGLPSAFAARGIRRYGFHGLSYEYVMTTLGRRDGAAMAKERIVIAHLGSGASLAAVRDGQSIETTMGFSALAGLPMGTRPGDLDPGIVLHLLSEQGMSAERLQHLLYEESGLLGLSGISPDMRDLLARLDVPAAAEAVDFFCYHARKHLAALTACLGGLDRVVFTGGIGAHAPAIRAQICDGLAYLGVALDDGRNARGTGLISAPSSQVAVEVMQTDEELMIARHVRRLLAEPPRTEEQ